MLNQITGYLDSPGNRLLASHQSGYRRGFGTTTALAKVTHDVYSNLDNDRCTAMVLVDFSLAFNCVNHRLLKTKLSEEFRFSENACRLISSFLEERQQSVRHENVTSTVREVIDGTPQGSCLSALLFSLYINSLPTVLKCNYQLYADDLQIYVSGPIAEIDELISKINDDLDAITRWATRNYLHPNPKKTQAIIFSKTGTVVPRTDIVFSGETVPLSDKVVNLGIVMDSNMTWTQQVNSVTQKAFNILRTFRRFSPVLSIATRRKLVQAVIMPVFTYGDIVYHPGLSQALKEQLHRCFKSAVRFVYGLRRRETTATVRNSILGHDLPTNYHIRTCCFMRQGYDGSLPEYIQDHLVRGQQQRTRTFVVPRHTTTTKKSVLIAGVSLWNRLPLDVKQKPTITAFKNAVRSSDRY